MDGQENSYERPLLAIADLGSFLKSQSAQSAGKSASNFFGSSLSTYIGTSISPLKVIHS